MSDNMKLALVTIPASTHLSGGTPPLGLGYLSSYLKKYLDVNTVLIDGAIGESIIEGIRKEKPDVVGVTSTTLEFSEAERIGREIKSRFDVPILIGGVHISALPHTLPRCFDIGVIGEGEQTLLELMELYLKRGSFSQEDLKRTKGVCFHQRDEVVITEERELIKPLDRIPYPDRELFKMEKYYLKKGPFGRETSMITSRGCPYRCVFCHSSRFWKTVRFHSPEYVVGEIKHLTERYRVKYIIIFDDIFHLSKRRVKKIVSLLLNEKINEEVKFGIQARAGLLDKETRKLLKEMGVIYLGFGLESGSEKTLKFLKKGTVTVEDNKRAAKLAKQFGFKIGSGFMIGNPDETIEDLQLTYKFMVDNPLNVMNVYITTPLPGTELWEYAKKLGLVSEHMQWSKLNQFFRGNGVILNTEIDRQQFTEMYNKMKQACEPPPHKVIYNALMEIINNPSNLPVNLRQMPNYLLALMKRKAQRKLVNL